MSKLYVARRQQRQGLYLSMGGKDNLMFFLPKMDSNQLDEYVRKELEKLGITKESDIQAVVEKAEKDYEFRVKTQEAIKEINRLMEIKKAGGKLMSVGYRKWAQAFYRPIKNKKEA